MSISLVLADRHPGMLLGLEARFAAEPDFTILASCQRADDAIRALQQHRPGVLVLDLPWSDNLAVFDAAEKSGTRVVLYPAAVDDEQAIETLRYGVVGMVLKDMPLDLLVQCVRKVHAGGRWLETQSTALALDRIVQREKSVRELAAILTPREIEVLRLVGSGLRNKEIAAKLHAGEPTIRNHVHNLYTKLQLTGRAELIAYARHRHIL
ncbi:MAG TPA: response regulator transcription factor [Candidatus Sulfotelmatobacter sp.]|nr:response regulator transcription factor [Candidatus Sulfotelmatobacter sp.]